MVKTSRAFHAVVAAAAIGLSSSAMALPLQVEAPAPRGTQRLIKVLQATPLPLPDPAINRGKSSATVAEPEQEPGPEAVPDAGATPQDAAATVEESPAEIIHDLSLLPEPVKKIRQQIVEAAASGDIERLRPLIGPGDDGQSAEARADEAIDTLRNLSGDTEGQEILAIMLDVLATGAARFDAGTPQESYVWPYFTARPIKELTPPERVELLRIVTAGDLAGMEEDGDYNFFRIAFSPDGKLKSFAGGD